MKKKLLTILFILLTSVIYGQVELKTISEIVGFSIENNPDVRTSNVTLDKTQDEIESYIKLDESTITGKANYKGDDVQDPDVNKIDTTIKIPILDQLSITGNVNQDLVSSVGLSIYPFIHNKDVPISKTKYEIALLNNKDVMQDAELSVIEATLDWMLGLRNLDLEEKEEARFNNLYQDDKDRYNNGSITLDVLQESLIDWSNSRKDLLEQKQNYYTLESDLYENLGGTKESVDIKLFEISDIKLALEELKKSLQEKNGNYLNNTEYKNSVLSTKSAKYNFDAIWVYDPDVSVGIEVEISEEGINTESLTASLTFSLGLDDFNSSKKKRAQEEYLISLKEKELSLNKAKLDFEQSKDLVESSEIESEILLFEYQQALILLEEAEVLNKVGEYSQLDLLESELFLQEAENNLFESLKDEYINILKYLKYF